MRMPGAGPGAEPAPAREPEPVACEGAGATDTAGGSSETRTAASVRGQTGNLSEPELMCVLQLALPKYGHVIV